MKTTQLSRVVRVGAVELADAVTEDGETRGWAVEDVQMVDGGVQITCGRPEPEHGTVVTALLQTLSEWDNLPGQLEAARRVVEILEKWIAEEGEIVGADDEEVPD